MKIFSASLKHRQRRWGCLILAIIGMLTTIEVCLDLTFLAVNGGAPITQTGSIMVEHPPETDIEFVEASIAFLREIGWWQDHANLVFLRRRLDCSQVAAPPRQRNLLFRKANRVTLLLTHINQVTIEFTEDGRELHYRLDDHGISRPWPPANLDITELQIESDMAIAQAELHGGNGLRILTNNDCYIYLSRYSGDSWEVDYARNNPFELLLCFNVDHITGVVKQVAERSLRPCKYVE